MGSNNGELAPRRLSSEESLVPDARRGTDAFYQHSNWSLDEDKTQRTILEWAKEAESVNSATTVCLSYNLRGVQFGTTNSIMFGFLHEAGYAFPVLTDTEIRRALGGSGGLVSPVALNLASAGK